MLLVSQRLDSPRMDPLLPGVKRKLTGAVDGAASVNGVSDTSMTQSSAKRLCLDDVTLAMGPNYPQHPFPSGPGMGNQGSGLEGNRLNSNNNGLGSPYTMPPKPNPGSTAVGSGSLASTYNPNGNSAAPSVEQELQEILDELTKNPDPSLSELDIEKILGNKVDEQTRSAGSFSHLEGSGTPKRSPQRASHLEAHLTQSPGFPQAGSPQMGPSPTGAPYTLPLPSKPVPSPLSASPLSSSSSQGQNQARSPMLSAALSNRSTSIYTSRAQQLQQLASNSKHHSTSSGGPPPAQPGLPSLGQQGSSWAGPSPPYRPGDKLPNSSPHQQPFSPASSIQSPQSSLISSITPAQSAGPSPPYRPEKLASPALAQPPFSPQNPIHPGSTPSVGSNSAVQGSQANYLSGIPQTSGSTRPSPPYRTEKQHPSPAGPTQPGTQPSTQGCPFNSQNSQAPNMSSQLYKAITASQPSSNSLKMLMQQSQPKAAQMQLSKGTPCNMGPETFSLNNTKPLRHFDPEPHASKMGTIPLGGFHNGSMQSIAPTSATSHVHLLQQRMQRGMQADSMLPHCGEEQNVGMVPHLQDPSAGPRPGQASNYNMLLRTQLMRKQEKQRQIEQMNGGQMSDCQQVAPFQGQGRTIPPECGGYPMGAPQHPNPAMMGHSGSILPNRMNLPPGSLSQVGHSGPYMGGTGPKQPFYHSSQDLGMPMRPSQSLMGVGGAPRQPTHPGHIVARPVMPGPSLGGGPTNHLRQALHQGTAIPPRMMCASQQQPHSQSQLWQSQQGAHPHMDPVNHQHLFPSGGAPPVCGAPQFPQRPGMPANFTVGQPPPNQLAPGMVSRHLQKMPPGQTLPTMSQQSLRMRVPLTAMEIMKPGAPLTMMDPAHGMAPPSYPSVDKHSLTQGYSSGPTPGSKLPSYDYPPQHHSNGSMAVGSQGVGGSEVDFIDTLVGSNDDWLNNLNMIDEYLEQNS
ncbi:mastermind-like domain-containing protein 1 isoform X1 [Tachysurus fulvidraco]|uniref:mastermind-like domain-containing protein 1 isoform X1 n=2 Tax=Tachysurus fulvidraco TaxID=1234273 RepID=UPI001FEED2D9|nr:mastermind-like domain-containing protein 1 isoform X1 [Tachysurus fulvidraco]